MPILRLLYIILLSLSAAALHAGGFGMRWMSCAVPGDSSEVWYRRTFVSGGRPQKAFVSVASTCRFVLYVNGRNVSASLYMPRRAEGDTSAVSVDVDVTRFLRRDSNTVAVLCSACRPAAVRVAVGWWGTDASGARFASMGARGWMCRRAPHGIVRAPGTGTAGEWADGRVQDVPWSRSPVEAALWMPVAVGGSVGACRECAADDGVRVARVLQPRFFDVEGPHAAVYDFSPGFWGLVRLTLRGVRRGTRIRVGDVQYVCSGEMDEQAYGRFAPSFARRVEVSGGKGFSPECVQSVEAICLQDCCWRGWSR